MKLLIIDTDPELAARTADYFETKKIATVRLDDYDLVLEQLQHINLHDFDAFIFAISEDDRRGLDLLEYLRLIDIVRPVIFLGHGDPAALLPVAFARGGEDFLAVPFSLKELELRVLKAIRRRMPVDEIDLPNAYSYVFSEQAIARGVSYIDLTRKQQLLLYLLMTHRNRLVSYEMIQDTLYGEKAATHNTIATHIRDIRKKIAGIPIKALRGMGYILKLDNRRQE